MDLKQHSVRLSIADQFFSARFNEPRKARQVATGQFSNADDHGPLRKMRRIGCCSYRKKTTSL